MEVKICASTILARTDIKITYHIHQYNQNVLTYTIDHVSPHKTRAKGVKMDREKGKT